MIKKFISLILCCVFAVSLGACSKPGIGLEERVSEIRSFLSETIPVTAEKTAFNYLTGEYNMATDRVGLRPISVSINNAQHAWPQSGLSQADILIEAETEGGITRFAALYTDTREVAKISTFRSLRSHLLEAAAPVDPIFGCVGASISAEQIIAEQGLDVLNGVQIPDIYYFDADRSETYAPEHCWFTSGARIDRAIKEQGVDETSESKLTSYFNFVETGETITPTGGDARNVHFYFSGSEPYDGDYRYDEVTKKYLKFQHGDPQTDVGAGDQNVQLSFKNVLVLFAKQYSLDTRIRMAAIDYQAGGTGYYFSNGRYEEITWSKADFESGFVLTKADGKELVVNTGKTMLCIVDREFANTLEIQ